MSAAARPTDSWASLGPAWHSASAIAGLVYLRNRLGVSGRILGDYMLAHILSSIGLVIAATGAFLLFRFNMPRRNRASPMISLAAAPNPGSESINRRYDCWTLCGYSLGVLGTLLQVAANWIV